MTDRNLVTTTVVVALGMGLAGFHVCLSLSLSWVPVTLPLAALLGASWMVAGWVTGVNVRRQGAWWPRRAPCLCGMGRLPDLGWHLRDLVDFLDGHWILAALVLGGCLMTLPMAPFCFLAWWLGVCRAGW